MTYILSTQKDAASNLGRFKKPLFFSTRLPMNPHSQGRGEDEKPGRIED
jgi:hypothetical protein